MKNIGAITALAMMMGNTHHKQCLPTGEITSELPPKPIPKGAKMFYFEDGFECVAISQKSADKKHAKHRLLYPELYS